MIDEQIRDGDFVVVEDRKTADNGEMVIALLGGRDVTLKKFYRDNGRIRLQPANPTMQPIFVDPDDVQIQGVVVGVMRQATERLTGPRLRAGLRRGSGRQPRRPRQTEGATAADKLCRHGRPQADQLHDRPRRRSRARARTYANFCAVAHTPFDFTLTFCEVQPLSEKEIREAEPEHVVRAPVRARIVVPVQFVADADRRAAGEPARLLRVHRERRLAARARCTDLLAAPLAPARDAMKPPCYRRHLRRVDASSRRRHGTALPQRVRTAGRHHPVGAVDRRAREHGDAGAVRALSGRARAGRRRARRRSRADHPRHRILPAEGEALHRHGGGAAWSRTAVRCPPTWMRCVKLPGVGRKTANVVLGHALGVPGLPVDRHVLRVANRLGIVDTDDPVKVEATAVRAAAARALDARLRHADPARPPHLPADSRCATLQCPSMCDYSRSRALGARRRRRRGGTPRHESGRLAGAPPRRNGRLRGGPPRTRPARKRR